MVPTRRRDAGDGPGIDPRLPPALLDWFRAHRRPLPWRRDRDPYRVWVAEVLLQQTRVAQAVPYFERLVARFPAVRALADARLADVMKVWQGAGYYARARHLHAAARELRDRWGGSLPSDVPSLEALPGVGPYIARAIAAIAFDAPVVALEANGRRVAARWTLEEREVRRPAVAHGLAAALAGALPPTAADAFNEAVMELGETVCLPRRPHCPTCPVSRYCRAYRETPDPGRIPRPPVRRPRPHLRAAVIVLRDRGRWLVQRRPDAGLLGGLWEFPGGKIRRGERPETAARRELREETGLTAGPLVARGVVRHAYSHFTVALSIFEGAPQGGAGPRARHRRWVTPAELARLPLPKATEKILERLGSRLSGRASRGSGSRRGRSSA